MLSKIDIIDFNGPEAKLYHSNTQKQNTQIQNGESFSNFTELFLLSLSTVCTIIYFIRSSGYSNLKAWYFPFKIANCLNIFSVIQYTRYLY